MTPIGRPQFRHQIERALAHNPVVALLGPRQCGKTTMAREFLSESSANYFDMEDPAICAMMANPMTALVHLRGLVVIDEAQRRPEIFPVLRVLADRPGAPARFLILGSAFPDLCRQSSESLAGRIEVIEMSGFGLSEVGAVAERLLWLRGGFPQSFLAPDEEASDRWRREFIRTFLERDLALLGFGLSPQLMHRFWTMISHYHGQIWNSTEVAASLGVAPNTVRSYLDALSQTFMVRQLQPWHENIGKRQVKSPKLYFRDSGIFHRLQGISSWDAMQSHPKLGASWEGFALEETLKAATPDEAYFWAVHSGSELDLLMMRNGRRIGVEFKHRDAPKMTRSLAIAREDLKLDELVIVYPGSRIYQLSDRVKVLPLAEIAAI
ncbi:ATP-binding protein [bacterium]|nr:ATP-binding protein [bacterium]